MAQNYENTGKNPQQEKIPDKDWTLNENYKEKYDENVILKTNKQELEEDKNFIPIPQQRSAEKEKISKEKYNLKSPPKTQQKRIQRDFKKHDRKRNKFTSNQK